MRTLINETTQLVEGIQNNNAELTSRADKLNEDIKQGMLGPKGKELKTKALREEMESYQWEVRNKANELLEKIDESEQKALERIELNAESVNADNVAELQLLKGLDTTSEELQRYATKYKNNPLAIKTLRQIAKDKEIFTTFPETEQDKTVSKYKELKTIVKTYRDFRVNSVGVQKVIQDTAIKLNIERLKNM